MLLFVVLCFVQTIHGIVRHPSNQNSRWQSGGELKVRKCELITTEMCRELGYNATGMPNLVGHDTQPDAEQQLSTFTPLIQYGCSSRLKFFLCSAYVPICSEKAVQLIGPCEPLCESVRRRCEPVLLKFGFPWPVALNCSRFLPRNEDDSMCIDVPTEDDETYATTTNALFQWPPEAAMTHRTTTTTATGNCNVFRNPANYVPLNGTWRCALLCSKDDVFSAEQKMFADAWMAVWSGLCFVTTLITILTFLIDMQRIVYPDRALVFMAVCYNVCSLSYLIRVTAGREVISCRAIAPDSKKVVVQEGLENTECTFVFLLLYYFSMAGSIWWAILSVVWFLNAGLDRPYESFARHGTLLHVVAWSVPAVAAIIVIVLRSVDADELTGMCHVGYRDQTTQLWFVLVPTAVFLLIGVVFLTAGLICSFRTCKGVDSGGTRPGKTTAEAMQSSAARSSKIRLGAFLLVHVLLTISILSIQCYEYANRQQWPLQPPWDHTVAASSQPNVTVLMFGMAASLTIGIVSAIWLWKGESLQSWQRFCSRLSRCCCCCRCTAVRSKQRPAAAVRRQQQAMSVASASTSDSGRLQTPSGRGGGGGGGKPIYRVTTTDAVERNGRPHDPHSSSSIAFNSSHQQCHHHHHHHHFHRNVSPLLKTHSSNSASSFLSPPPPPPAPPPSCDKRSARSHLQFRFFNGDISVL